MPLNDTIRLFKEVFARKINLALFALVFSGSATLFLLTPHFATIKTVLFGNLAIADKIYFVWSIYASVPHSMPAYSIVLSLFIALLLSVNVALFVEFLRQRSRIAKIQKSGVKFAGANFGALVLALFGAGCASCGVFVISYIFGFFGAGTILSFLPFGGLEFNIFAILVLTASIIALIKQMQRPAVCYTIDK